MYVQCSNPASKAYLPSKIVPDDNSAAKEYKLAAFQKDFDELYRFANAAYGLGQLGKDHPKVPYRCQAEVYAGYP